MTNIGQVIDVKKENGNTVQRKCVAIVDPKYLEEHKRLQAENRFTPIFVDVKTGYVWLSMTRAERSGRTPEQIKKDALEKLNDSKIYNKEMLAQNENELEATEKRLTDLEKSSQEVKVVKNMTESARAKVKDLKEKVNLYEGKLAGIEKKMKALG